MEPSTTTPAPAPRPPAGRYGPEPTARGRRRTVAALAVLVLAGLALVVWLGLRAAATPVRWNDIGYDVDGTTSVQVTFEVIKDPDASAVCRVQALSHSHAEVGVQSVTVGPAATQVQRVTTTIPTAEQAVTALVHSCELADS